jgi:hypothetical protein
MRTVAVVLLLAATLAAAPRLKDKPEATDYRYIRPGLEFDTADGYRVRVDRLFLDDPEWGDRAHCEYLHHGVGGWAMFPVYVGDEFARRPPTLAHIDALYRGRVRLKP